MIVLTACYSRNPCQPYDTPKAPPAGVEAFADSDDPLWYDTGWKRGRSARSNFTTHPRLRAKPWKAAPNLFFDVDDVVWVDSSMVWTGQPLSTLLELVPKGGVGCFKHRFRDCIYDEAEASLVPGFDRYRREPIREQVEHYRAQGHPEHFGLTENGIIVWRGAQRVVGARWLAEMLAWSSQDQLSFMPVCRLHDIKPTILPGTAVENDWFRYTSHKLHD